jgi:hypothetical protein
LKLLIKIGCLSYSKTVNCCKHNPSKHLDNHKKSGNEHFFYSNKCALWTAFSTEGEWKLIDYITTASHVHYGLTRKEVMKLTHQFGKEVTKYPVFWDVNG